MTTCAFCGRENDAASRFCIDCGKPMNPSAVRVGPAYVPHPSGGQPQPVSVARRRAARVRRTAPRRQRGRRSCPQTRVSEAIVPALRQARHRRTSVLRTLRRTHLDDHRGANCAQCGASYTKGVDLFCARCGNRVGQRVSVELASNGTQVIGAGRMARRSQALAARRLRRGRAELHARSRRGGGRPRRRRHQVRGRSLHVAAPRAPRAARRTAVAPRPGLAQRHAGCSSTSRRS